MPGTSFLNKWEKISPHKRAGVVAPLFSIYSKNSIGVGDFSDLQLFIDWAASCGNSIVQLLPMNEVGAQLCPYDSLSSFALEPTYLSCADIPVLSEKKFQEKIKQLKRAFPAGKPFVDYGIKAEKILFLKEIYRNVGAHAGTELKAFESANSYWLFDFALFKVLKQFHRGLPWHEWDDDFMRRDPAILEKFWRENHNEIQFEIWLQWMLFKQLSAVKKYAESKKVLLKGDLPILVSKDSADVWAHPEFFKLDFASGAPPDMYCAKGQRWGMPPYNWEKIEADGFRYIKEKLSYAQHFYDIVRIDHVVGLFRIWSIPASEPKENQGINGSFDPRDEHLWEPQGRKILSVILQSTDMLVCAEDLGVIPASCTSALADFGIPGNDVQRWVKEWKTRHDFLKPEKYRHYSVAMLSTHDTTNWAAWWEYEAGTVDEGLFIRRCNERGIDYQVVKPKLFDATHSSYGRLRWLDSIDSVDALVGALGKRKEEVMDFVGFYLNSYREKEKLWKRLGLFGPMQEKCTKEILAAALKMTFASSAVFCIHTIVDYLYLTGKLRGDPYPFRINTPGIITSKNWSLVMPLSLEELLTHPVTKEIKEMVLASVRIA